MNAILLASLLRLCVVVVSIDPGDGHPLRGVVQASERRLQLGERVVDVVVHDAQVEVVAVRSPQLFRLAHQHLQ